MEYSLEVERGESVKWREKKKDFYHYVQCLQHIDLLPFNSSYNGLLNVLNTFEWWPESPGLT